MPVYVLKEHMLRFADSALPSRIERSTEATEIEAIALLRGVKGRGAFGRVANNSGLPQVRVVVNTSCGRACYYCRPAGESSGSGGSRQIDEEALVVVAHSLKRLGIDALKLTGGDPALWPPLERCVRRLKQEVGLSHIQILSRSPQIGILADCLASAGVGLFNLSIDTLKPDLHKEITGRGDLSQLLTALGSCVRTGVPCKVNMVVLEGVNSGEVDDLVLFCERAGVRSLKFLDLITDLHNEADSFSPRLMRLRNQGLKELYSPLARIAERFVSDAVTRSVEFQGALGHPMTTLRLRSGLELIFKDSSAGRWYGKICQACRHFPCRDALMALRITPELRLQFCLLNEAVTIDIAKELHDQGALDKSIGDALRVYSEAKFVDEIGHPRSDLAMDGPP